MIRLSDEQGEPIRKHSPEEHIATVLDANRCPRRAWRIGVGMLFDDGRECRIGFVDLAVLYLEFLLFLDKGTIAYLRRR